MSVMKKFDDVTLTAIEQLQQNVRMHSDEAAWHRVQADLEAAKLRAMVAEKLKENGVPIDTSAVCLKCGVIRDASMQACPACEKAS